MSKDTPLVKQYKKIKAQYPDAFLFFRLGDFYELFDEDAIEASRLMEITLTKRKDRPMCGIPYHSATNYIKKLLNKSKSVAICEQVEDASKSKGLVKREVVRVITPGTIIEDDLLAEDYNNFLASVSKGKDGYGIVFVDISTGDFMGCRVEKKSQMESELSRTPVKEVIISDEDEDTEEFIKQKFREVTITKKNSWYFTDQKSEENIKDYFNISTLKGWELDKNPEVASACGGLIEYLTDTQKDRRVQLKNFHLYSLEEKLVLDRNAQENLELVKNLQEGTKKNTLYEVLDFTDTAMGRRKLVQYILRPLKDVPTIRRRLNGVEELLNNPSTGENLSRNFELISDMERILSKSSFGNCNARDLLSLKESLKVIPDIKDSLEDLDEEIFNSINDKLEALEDLVEELEAGIKESPPLTVKEGDIIKKGYDDQLDELIEQATGDKEWISNLEKREQERLDISSLKVGYNKVYGYYIEVTKTHTDKIPENYNRKQTLVNSERYITEELKKREDSILGAEEKKASLEYKLFKELRDMVNRNAEVIQSNADLIARLDVLNSFRKASRKYSYTKPQVTTKDDLRIKEGRHPIVECSMGTNEFVPNNTKLDKEEDQVLIITGPNMAGKSTYLKQVALITIMAQMGCFVPAAEAKIGAVDRVFTRIGSGENLAGGQSTFMVEMTEVASILSNATKDSLLILDEVGRGTSTFDGISIAWSVIEEISQIKSRTLFATHYYELTELPLYMDNVNNYNFAVREWKDKRKIVFLRKLQEGSGDKSYGIHCADLAGVPKNVIDRAWQIFNKLEEEELDEDGLPRMAPEDVDKKQMNLFETPVVEDEFKKKIENLDLNDTTPLDLMNKVKEWKEEIDGGN
ncbi:MAG: DNA mismatch repair protein MutS [Elusimicrobiota bacterium]